MSKHIFNEEKLYWEIKAAKEKWEELKLKVTKIEYEPFNQSFYLYFIDDSGQEDVYSFEKSQVKVLENLTDDELNKVTVLGERAIQFEKLDIQIGVEELLYGLQIINTWLNSLK